MCGNWLKKSTHKETYTPVVNDATNHMIFTIAAKWGWILCQINIVMAYLYNQLDKTIYMWQSIRFEIETPHMMICTVEDSLYRLNPAVKIWYNFLTALLYENGFKSSLYNSAL